MKKFIAVTLPAVIALPAMAQATIWSLLNIVQSILNTLVPVLIALATVFVIWKAIQFARAEGDDKAEHQKGMISAIIALFILVSIWGLVSVLNSTFGINQGTGPANINNFQCYNPSTQTYQNC
jgi:hypothetical protein